MQKVNVKKTELLETLRVNCDHHREEFLVALECYRLEAIEVLEEAIDDAKKGKRIMTATHLTEPMDMTREYKKVIKMLEMSVDEEIELTNTEFQNYVCDDWSWSGAASLSNSAYTAKWSS